MSHEMLVLANGEKDKGYWKGTCFNEMGRQNIRAGLSTKFGFDLPWGKIKSRLEHLRRQYDIYKRVTKNATGLGFTAFGEIDMSTDWWDQLVKMCPEATKLRTHPLRDIPLLDTLYHKVTISVSEGWQHQEGTSQLPQQIESEEEEAYEIPPPANRHADSQKTNQTNGSKRIREEKPSRSKSSRKRPNSDHWDRITSTLENQERFWSAGRKTFDSFNPFNTAICTEELLKMSTLDQDSELYWAALDHLACNENGRQIFMTLPNEQQKIKYLERATGKKN
ncbi:Myb/SANT-like domain-containing protein [Hirschfeldia incana]|nr:Myb/SANT-like domain-containing protein [Hirschfeldia incana]